MTGYDSTNDTQEHITQVRKRLHKVIAGLHDRADLHDLSKLESPEKEAYDALTPRLKDLTYGSEEYRATLREMKPAIQHHYAHNSHHPEHHEQGIAGMDLLDLIEMFCDWAAAVQRVKDGDLGKSLEINKERFGISDQLMAILANSIELVK